MSIRYLKRNKVRAADIKNVRKEMRERYFDIDRVAEDCDFNGDIVDQRIFYEMTGQKIDEQAYLDETTDSDISEDENASHSISDTQL